MSKKKKLENIKSPKSGKLAKDQPRQRTYFVEKHGVDRSRDTRPPIDKVLAALPDAQEIGPDHWTANCPCKGCHDTGQHLNIYVVTGGKGQKLNDGDVVLRCYHAGQECGCTVPEILDALGLEMADIYAHDTDETKSPACRKPAVPRRESPLYKTLGKTVPLALGELRTAPDAARTWAPMVKRFQASLSKEKLQELADELGVTTASLECLHVGMTNLGYTFPEFNGAGEVVGVSLRMFEGGKCMLLGSHRGIYIPQGWYTRNDPVLLVEGASDVAAATMLGFAALGRPDCSSGAKLLAEAILTGADGYDPDVQTERAVVVMGENDMKPDGRWPGKTGAMRVAKELAWHLGRPVQWALPDKVKDLREWATVLKQKELHHA